MLSSPDASITIFEKEKRYARILNNLPLPAGDYTKLIIHLKGCSKEDETSSSKNSKISNQTTRAERKGRHGYYYNHYHHHRHRHNHPHTIQVDGETYPLHFFRRRLVFRDAFQVEAGKLTTLNAKPKWPRLVRYNKRRDEYRLRMILEPTGTSTTTPVEKIWIHMKSISVTSETGETIQLAKEDVTFDLLALRDTAVLLVGNEMVPAGTYKHFTIELDPSHAIQVEGDELPLTIVNEYTTSFTVPGPFELRGGRISEIILDFNPNLSVYSTQESGYVLEPDIAVVSILSLTPEQDLRFIEALGEYANPVAREAEVVFEGTVKELEYILAKNIYDKDMIYQDLNLKVEDRLRGEIETPNNFPLQIIGGTYGGMTLKVSHMPEFKKQERFLLFLKEVDGILAPVRGDMGKITL